MSAVTRGTSSSTSPPSAASPSRRPMIKARKDKSAAAQAPSDKFYGQKDLAEFCQHFIHDMFSLADCSQQASPPIPSSSEQKEPPALVLFIAYALYRTRLPTTIIHHALFLLHRLKTRYPSARGTSSSPHRLFLSALMLSSKIQMDDTYSNRSWAIVGGNFFALREVNQMERELFAFLEWNAVVSREELDAYTEVIEADWKLVKSRQQGVLRSRSFMVPAPVDGPVIGKRRRSDTAYTEAAIEKAQALRHKRAADAAIALLQPSQTTAARYRHSIDGRYVEDSSPIQPIQESSASSSFVSSPSSDQFFHYHSSSSYATSPATSSPTSSKGPITPEEADLQERFSDSCSVNVEDLPPSRRTSWSAIAKSQRPPSPHPNIVKQC